MKRYEWTILGLISLALVGGRVTQSAPRVAALSGEPRVWHAMTLTFSGPQTSEDARLSPFLDYRLDVTFTCGGRQVVVPGYYAADGRAAESSADRGNQWRVHFVADEAGRWTYRCSFRTGVDVALSSDLKAGRPTAFDGTEGSFVVRPTDKDASDLRGKGMLRYVGKRYLQFAGTGEYFLKAGADSPENFLAYADFDGTYDTEELTRPGEAVGPKFLHEYRPHLHDWRPGDPAWKAGKGKAIIGALNYLASKGMNSVYFLTYNVDGGDGKDVWPWTSPTEKWRFDCSKLDQWETVFSHMDRLGLQLHVVTQETENDHGMDGGELGRERRLYYRELIARFSHHLALVWNLGEENRNTDSQRKAFAQYIRNLDPYDHPIVCHTFPGQYDQVYTPLLGFACFEGPSLQTTDTHRQTIQWIDRSTKAGRPWFVCLDEIGPAEVGVKPDADDYGHDEVRTKHLWPQLLAGGAGVEWYFGYRFANNDLNCEDWRSRDHLWDLTRYSLDFFRHLPIDRMSHHDELISSKDDYCLAEPGKVYVLYLPHGGTTDLDLTGTSVTFTVQWFNPRQSGLLQDGSVTSIEGPGKAGLGQPPSDPDKDWAVLVRR